MIYIQSFINIILTYIIYFKNPFKYNFDYINFLFGINLWTFIEYIMHRFIFHTSIYKKYHLKHHNQPLNYKYLFGPYRLGIPINLLLFLVFDFNIYYGIACGYLLYEITHYSIHYHSKIKIINHLVIYHDCHHTNSKLNFSFTTPFYDSLFNTIDKKHTNRLIAILCSPFPLIYFIYKKILLN